MALDNIKQAASTCLKIIKRMSKSVPVNLFDDTTHC